MKPFTCRDFSKTLAAAGTAAALTPWRALGANDRVRQVGIRRRSVPVIQEAAELVRSGEQTAQLSLPGTVQTGVNARPR